MNKRLIVTVLCGIMVLLFASCSHPSLTGTWTEPLPEGSTLEESGFTLFENGEMKEFNMPNRVYHSWEKVGDMVYFKGAYTGTNPHEFVDTMKLVKLDEQQLVLEQAGYQVVYKRK